MYWNECKTKSENGNKTNEYRYFLESNFVRVNRLIVLVYTNEDNNAKSRAYSRNLGQRPVLAWKGTFLWKNDTSY